MMKIRRLSFPRTAYGRAVLLLLALLLPLNALCFSTAFCDWYTARLFPLILASYGRFSDLFPFSFGEILIVIGLLLIALALLLALPLPFVLLRKRRRRGASAEPPAAPSKDSSYLRFARHYYRAFLLLLLIVALVMTLDCSIPYRCSRLYADETKTDYSVAELRTLRNFIVEQCNYYALSFPRDDDGTLLYDVDVSEIDELSRLAMQQLAEEYPRLAGYYPDMKPISGSAYMTQAGMAGVYFPFSMESNYNALMYFTNFYSVFCHERAHIKGYMYEEEANFLAYLACIRSDDPMCRYAGYLSVLGYVNGDYYESTTRADYRAQPHILPQVRTDSIFITEETQKTVEQETVVSAETASQINHSFMDSYLEYYDIDGGRASYGRVTGLLLRYYSKP